MTSSHDFYSSSSEYDASSALAELDRALRSNNIGEKAELIIRVPSYFQKYPFPIFVNATFLKLTELFRSSTTNFLRKLVLQVAERSVTHLDKIISCDEICKRILTVSYSNDPISRAITLRLLGCLSNALSDRKQIHHLIRTSFDSHDNEELEAAIFAAEHFAQKSPEFANGVAEKMIEMLKNEHIPIETKIALIPVLAHVHVDAHTTQKVFETCEMVLKVNCSYENLVCSLLKMLTELSLTSLIILEKQLNLLIDFLDSEKSCHKLITVLECLAKIAKQTPHFWTKGMFFKIYKFVEHVFSTKSQNSWFTLIELGCKVAEMVGKSSLITTWSDFDETYNMWLKLTSELTITNSNLASCSACVCVTVLSNFESTEVNQKQLDRTVVNLINILLVWKWQNSFERFTKILFRSFVDICLHFPDCTKRICEAFVAIANHVSADQEPILIDLFCALNDCDNNAVVGVLNYYNQLSSLSIDETSRKSINPKIALLIDDLDQNHCQSIIENSKSDFWSMYRTGRFSCRYGRYRTAMEIFRFLQNETVADFNCHWMKFLSLICQAECKLLDQDFSESISIYAQAIFHLKATVTPNYQMWFPMDYCNSRREFIRLVLQMENYRLALKVQPQAAEDVMSKNFDTIKKQLNNLTNQAKSLIDDYDRLLLKCFDADNHTLQHLALERCRVFIILQSLQSLIDGHSVVKLPNMIARNASNKMVLKKIENFCTNLAKVESSTDLNFAVLDHVLHMINGLANSTVSLPRYLFQALQSTAIKIVLSPQPTGSDQFVLVPNEQKLVFKVEGVVQQNCKVKSGPIRKVGNVLLSAVVNFSSDTTVCNTKLPKLEQSIEKTITPHNDYFSAEFSLQFPENGTVTVSADVIDAENGRLWKLGAVEQLKVKCLNNNYNRSINRLTNLSGGITLTSFNRSLLSNV